MIDDQRWVLPDGMNQYLPEEAEVIETLRQKILAIFSLWGYRLVITPMVEFLESLLVGTGQDLDLETFKFTDHLTGRMLGIRADITPQVARLDAKFSADNAPTRFCYLGSVLRSRADRPALTRSPLQVGAELYGHSGVESDLEVIRLLVETLAVVGVSDLHLEIGHVGIFRGLVSRVELAREAERQLFDILQRKAVDELRDFMASVPGNAPVISALERLTELSGGVEVVTKARAWLSSIDPEFESYLSEIETIVCYLDRHSADVVVHIDLSELRGYHYHTGLVFGAFVPKLGRELARGGRYDGIGAAYGRARPATGFSLDLKLLPALVGRGREPDRAVVFAPPPGNDHELIEEIRGLRCAGKVVVERLSDAEPWVRENGSALAYKLAKVEGRWSVLPL